MLQSNDKSNKSVNQNLRYLRFISKFFPVPGLSTFMDGPNHKMGVVKSCFKTNI